MRMILSFILAALIGMGLLTSGIYFAVKLQNHPRTTKISLIAAIVGSVILIMLRLFKWVIELRIRF